MRSAERQSVRVLSRFRKILEVRIDPLDIAVVAGLAVSLTSILGFLGDVWWVLDLASHFRVQYAFILIAGASLLFVAGRSRIGAVLLLVAIANFVVIGPQIFGPTVLATDADLVLRAFVANVNTRSGNVAAVRRAITDQDPDVVILTEIDKHWLAQLISLEATHPHSIAEPRSDNFGIAIFSKLPLTSAEIVPLGQIDVPSVVARFKIDAKLFYLVGTHLLPPVGFQNIRWQTEQREELINLVNALSPPLLLVGDLNMTNWSAAFRDLLLRTNLRDASIGRGLQPTWPVQMPPLLIPLDHCLYSKGVEILAVRIGPNVGSDHYPLTIDFVFR